jgi:hypothetical protein
MTFRLGCRGQPVVMSFRIFGSHTGGSPSSSAFNWFFAGHRNKLTFDFSRLHDRNEEVGRRWENRIRLQWDVLF